MSDSGEVLKKADALLGRYGRGVRAEAETDFPVLTEIVEPAVPATGDARLPEQAQALADAPVLSDEQRRAIEARITEQVQHAVASHLGELLGEPLRERLDACLQAAVESVAAQIRDDLESMVQAAVAEAIERVLDRLREPGPPASA